MTVRRRYLSDRLTRLRASDTVCAVDPLADMLDLSRVRGALMANVRARAPWGLAVPQSEGAAFHAVTAGTAWLRMPGSEPVQLMPGDVLLLPSGAPHRLSALPSGRCIPFDRVVKEQAMSTAGDLDIGGAGAVTTFVCAGYDYDLEVAEPLMRLLPDVVHVPADPVAGRDVAAIVELLALEVGARRPGSRAAAARAIDMLLIAAIRHWADRAGGPGRPELAARPARPADRARRRAHPRAPRRAVDRRRAGARGASLARRARAPLRRARGRAAAQLRRALAHAPRRAAPEVHERQRGGDRPRRRLHVGVRVQPRVRAPPRPAAGPLPPARARA